MRSNLLALTGRITLGVLVYLAGSVCALFLADRLPIALAFATGFLAELIARHPLAAPLGPFDAGTLRLGLAMAGWLAAVWAAALVTTRRASEEPPANVRLAGLGLAGVILAAELPQLLSPHRWPVWVRTARALFGLSDRWSFAFAVLQVRNWPLAVCLALVAPLCIWAIHRAAPHVRHQRIRRLRPANETLQPTERRASG